MNSGTFSFTLLQYHHSQILGEILNIGLVVYFPDYKVIKFIYPDKLIRLRFAYPDVPEKTIKNYFKYFESRVNELNNHQDIFSTNDIELSLESFLQREFLASDSSSLQFGQVKKSILYSNDIDAISNQLYNLYFSVFNQNDNTEQKIDEITLLNKYKKLFNEINHDKQGNELRLPKVKYEYEVKTNSGVTLKFDFAWQATSRALHLVKPISFDLIKPDAITNKAYRFWGQFSDLQSKAEKDKLNFDVLLSKPSRRDLFKSYDLATHLLSNTKSVNLIEFDGLKQYAQTTFDQIQFEG